MKYGELVEPRDHRPHRKNTETVLRSTVGLSVAHGGVGIVRALRHSGTNLLVMLLFNVYINADDGLLETLDTASQEVLDLRVALQQF